MKKTGIVLLLALTAAAAWGEDGERTFTINSFARSGVLWTNDQVQGKEADEQVKLGNLDDAGSGQGRWRLEMEYFDGKAMGVKTRLQWDTWSGGAQPSWVHAFVYGNFFEDNLTLSVGKLGGSPWSSGGPEMWKELEVNGEGGGIRAEWTPSFVPGKLNAGFVLNYFNQSRDGGWVDDDGNAKPITLAEILKETVLGVSYAYPDIGLIRFAFRLDSEYDFERGSGEDARSTGEEEMIYRVEEHIIKDFLPGFKIWAMGYGKGMGRQDSVFNLENWLFAEYDPEMFTAQVRIGYIHTRVKRDIIFVKPSFYWKFFDNLLNVGAAFWYGQDFGENKKYAGSPYSYIEVEPKIQLNFGSSYVAFAYTFRQQYDGEFLDEITGVTTGPIRQVQKMNLRFSLQL